jgi:hypothetical protein
MMHIHCHSEWLGGFIPSVMQAPLEELEEVCVRGWGGGGDGFTSMTVSKFTALG